MALVNPCNLSTVLSNTGSECDDAMLATSQIWLMVQSLKWTATDELNFTAYLDTHIHAAGDARVFPIFGYGAPIVGLTNNNEGDVLETFDNGAKSLIRRGMMNRTFMTDKGGLCLAQNLFGMGRKMAFIEVDSEGKVLRMKNADGTFSGFPSNLSYSPTPDLADFKNGYKNKFMLDFDPNLYIGKGSIVKGDATEDILSLIGLIDTLVSKGTVGSASTTHIFLKVKTECAETDLVVKYTGTGSGKIGQISNFVIKNAAGAIITPSAVAVVGSEVDLTGAFPTGTTITAQLAAPSVWKTNGIEGYEGINILSILIP